MCIILQDGLCSVFSSFGPLYLLKVCPNALLNPPGFYALIKFYSAAQASKAQRQTDGRSLFQSSPLKVITAEAFNTWASSSTVVYFSVQNKPPEQVKTGVKQLVLDSKVPLTLFHEMKEKVTTLKINRCKYNNV